MPPTAAHSRPRLSVGTPQHYRWLHGIVKTVLVLNLFDALFTMLWVGFGLAREANSLMEGLVHEHPVAFVAVKTGLVGMGSWLLWQGRRHPGAVIAIFVAFLTYYLVLLYHVEYAALMARQLFALGR